MLLPHRTFAWLTSSRNRLAAAALLWIFASWPLPLRGQTTTALTPPRNLEELLRQATPQPLAEGANAQAAQALRNSLQAVRRHLAREPHGESWSRYLRLERLQTVLDRYPAANHSRHLEAVAANDDQAVALEQEFQDSLGSTLDALVGTEAGLERAPLQGLRQAIQQYRRVRRVADEGDAFAERFQENLQTIRESAATLAQAHDADAAERLADACGWLARRGQAPRLLSSMRDNYSQPNVLVSLHGDVIGALTEKPVYDVKPIRENANGASIRGQATVVGTVRLHPVPASRGGELEARFFGYVDSDMHGAKGPVQFNLLGHTDLQVAKRIILTREQFYVLPTTTQASSQLRTGAVCTKFKRVLGKVVRNVARKEIEKQRPQATRDLSRQAAEGFREEFEEELLAELGSAKRDLDLTFTRLDLNPSRMDFASDANNLHLNLGLNGDMVVTAAPPPPPATPGPGAVCVRLHESAINRMFSQIYGGEDVDLSELAKELEKGGEAANEGGEEQDADGSQPPSFRIKFAEHQPLTAQFDGDRLRLRMSGAEFIVDNDLLLSAMVAEFVFRIEHEGETIVLIREGQPKIEPPPEGRNIKYTLQRPKLRTELNRQLPRRIELAPQELPGLGEKLGKMTVTQFQAQTGWLRLLLQSQS